jgi:hypothetical protein
MSLRKLLAALTALCLLSGCGAQSSAPAETTPAAEGSAPQSEAASGSAEAEQSAPTEESAVPAGGSAAGLEWSFETKHFSTTESSGREVYYYEFVYPVFSGEGSEELNEVVKSTWLNYMDEAEQESGVNDSYLDDYRDSMDEAELNNLLPFFDLFRLDTVWANDEYVSITGDAGFWSGGAHPYSYKVGAVLRRSDALAQSLDELVDIEKLPELVRDRFPEDAWADDEDYRAEMIENVVSSADSPEAYRLEDGGLRLYYNVGDAVPRLEIFLSAEELASDASAE